LKTKRKRKKKIIINNKIINTFSTKQEINTKLNKPLIVVKCENSI